MQIVKELKFRLKQEDSMFRAQLMREDIARLEKLAALANEAEDMAAFKKAGTYIGWTQNDMMTHQLKEPLAQLLEAIYSFQTDNAGKQHDEVVSQAWLELCRTRNERLFKCL